MRKLWRRLIIIGFTAFELQAFNAKFKGVFTDYIVAMITYYAMKMTTTPLMKCAWPVKVHY